MEYVEPEKTPQDEGFLISKQREQEISTFIYQLTTADLIEELEHVLRAEKHDKATDTWKGDKDKAVMNDLGINSVLKVCRPIISKNTFMSVLDKKEIALTMDKLHENLAEVIGRNWKAFGIERSERHNTLWLILHFLHIGLKRAEDGATLDALTQIQQVLEKRDMSKKDEGGKGIMGWFSRGK